MSKGTGAAPLGQLGKLPGAAGVEASGAAPTHDQWCVCAECEARGLASVVTRSRRYRHPGDDCNCFECKAADRYDNRSRYTGEMD